MLLLLYRTIKLETFKLIYLIFSGLPTLSLAGLSVTELGLPATVVDGLDLAGFDLPRPGLPVLCLPVLVVDGLDLPGFDLPGPGLPVLGLPLLVVDGLGLHGRFLKD